MTNQYNLEKVVDQGASRAVVSAREYMQVEGRFRGAVGIVNEIKEAMGRYLETEDAFLQASGITGKMEGIKQVGLTVWSKLTGKDPRTYSIGKQLDNLLGVFDAYHTKISDVADAAQTSFEETEQHVTNLLEAQMIINKEITEVIGRRDSLKSEYDGLIKKYDESKESREESGQKAPLFMELELQKEIVDKQREYEAADTEFNEKAMAAAIAENTYDLIKAYRKTARIVVEDAKETARNLHTIKANIAPLMKYVIATAELTEIHARGVNCYMAVKAVTNEALPALAHLAATTSEMRDVAMLGRPFIESDTLQIINRIGDGLQTYREEGRKGLMERVTEKMLAAGTRNEEVDEAVDAEFTDVRQE